MRMRANYNLARRDGLAFGLGIAGFPPLPSGSASRAGPGNLNLASWYQTKAWFFCAVVVSLGSWGA